MSDESYADQLSDLAARVHTTESFIRSVAHHAATVAAARDDRDREASVTLTGTVSFPRPRSAEEVAGCYRVTLCVEDPTTQTSHCEVVTVCPPPGWSAYYDAFGRRGHS